MGFDEGQVIFDSPNLTYFSGQTVRGRLEFDENYFMNFRGFYVLMTGFCDVHWTTTHSRKVEDRVEEYTVEHNSHEVYYEQKVYLAGGSAGQHSLGVGHHVFPFECRIPPHCPSSFEGSFGNIRYIFKFVVDRPSQLDLEKTGTIQVISQKDLNAEPYCRRFIRRRPSTPKNFHFQESYCCCCMTAGGCEVVAKLPYSGYCSKQNIPIMLNVANDSNVKMKNVTFEIKQMITYTATHTSGKKYEEEAIATLKKGPIPAKTTRNWALTMPVPNMNFPNIDGCKFIEIEYLFKVTVSPSGCHTSTEAARRIVFGHIPLRDAEGYPPAEDQITNPPVALVQHVPAPPTYPGVNPAFPGANPAFPGTNPAFPGTNPAFSGMNPAFPGTNPAFPGTNPAYPGANPVYPGENPPYTGTNKTFPWANPEFQDN